MEPTLFAEEAKHTDRALLNKEENENLDQQLGLCLALLGPSVLVRPCGQILEWLIRRFRFDPYAFYQQYKAYSCQFSEFKSLTFLP